MVPAQRALADKAQGLGSPRKREADLAEVFSRIELSTAFVQRHVRYLVLCMQFAKVSRCQAKEISRFGRGKAAQMLACVRSKIALEMHANRLMQSGCITLKLGKDVLC